MTEVIVARHLSKSFYENEVISDLNMTVKKGHIYGLIGPNGSGKTTVMKLILNLLRPTKGVLEVFGEQLLPGHYRYLKRIGSMIEYPIFYEKLTADDNLSIHCNYMNVKRRRKAIDEALRVVGLSQRRLLPVSEFSLGMKQRLGIAKAMIANPEVILLDEPFNGLDPDGVDDIREMFMRLNREQEMTIIISSHQLSELQDMLDTVAIMKEGKLISELTRSEIRRPLKELYRQQIKGGSLSDQSDRH